MVNQMAGHLNPFLNCGLDLALVLENFQEFFSVETP